MRSPFIPVKQQRALATHRAPLERRSAWAGRVYKHYAALRLRNIAPPCGLANGTSDSEREMLNRLVTVVVVVSLLAGSVAGQKKYEPPAVKTPDTFRGADAVAPTDQTSIGDLKWFEVF